MQLTKHTDYAFRVLIFLAMKDDEELATIKEISEFFDISRSHMMKIVQKLANASFVLSIRGKQGGIKLGKPTKDINLRDIVELMEATLKPVDCTSQPCRQPWLYTEKYFVYRAKTIYGTYWSIYCL